MGGSEMLQLKLRSQRLVVDERGYTKWQVVTAERAVPARRTAVIVCDMWDNHWSRAALERESAMVAPMNEVIRAARGKGVRIIHAPSETMAFYADHPARRRMLALSRVEPPPDLPHDDPPLPVDDSDGGSDTGETSWHTPWTRQHPGIEISNEDMISDHGGEVYGFLRAEQIEQVLIMGVHTGMCILNRPFAIKQMVRWGVSIALVRDLTDASYNPARRPYVSHEEGTALIIGYIEKFWCPTVESRQLTA